MVGSEETPRGLLKDIRKDVTRKVLPVSELICHENPRLQALFEARHEAFLREALGDAEAERIMRSVAESDTPSSLEYQFALLREVGFREVGLLHKNIVFGAYYAVKQVADGAVFP